MSRFYSKSAGTKGLRRKLYLAVLTAMAGNAYALPQGAQVTVGQANINGSDTTLTIEQNSQRAVLEYDSFNVAAHEQVDFIQPNSEAVALNRVLGSNLSEIHGTINANGQVYLINPHGVLFGAGAEVNVGGLVATTLDTSDADFINQREHFRGQGPGLVENRGRINAVDSVVLLGADVTNSGQINVPGGEVMLRSSRDVLLHSAGSEIPILVEDPELIGRLVNEGEVRAGRVAMVLDGQGSRDVYDNAINNSGIVRAVNARGEGGSVELLAAGGDIVNQGIVDASAMQGTGGSIKLQAERYGQTGQLKVDGAATGNGGSIDLNIDDTLVLHPTARLSANAGDQGDGGDIIVYSHNATWYTEGAGISARGGNEAGNGGFVEVSGRNLINIASAVDVGAKAGRAGLWYIDPTDITIQANTQSGGAFTLNAGEYLWTLDDPAPAISSISVQMLMNSLMNGDVIIDTASAQTSPGDISVAASIDFHGMPAGRSLTLRADRNVSFQGAAGIGDSDFNDEDWFNLNIEAGGDVLLNSTSFINVRSGTLTVDAGGDFTLAGTASMVAHVADINAAGAYTMHAESSVLVTERLDVAVNDDITLAAVQSHGSAEDTLRFTTSNGAIIDDGDATTVVEIAGAGVGDGGVYLQAATGIGSVGLGTTKLGVVNTTSGNVNLNSDGDLTLTSIGLGDNMAFDIAAAGDLIYSGSLGSDLTGVTGSAINLNAGANLLFNGSLAGASPADHNVDITLTAATDVAMQDGAVIDSGTGFITVTAQAGNAAVTGLTTANTAVDSIGVFAANGAIMDAGDSQSDLSVANGGFVLRSMAGISGLETQSNFIDAVSTAGGVSLNEAASVEVLRLQAAGAATLTAGNNLSFANSAVINVPELRATAGDAIIVPDAGLNASGRLDLTGNDIYAQSGRQVSLQAPRVNINSASAGGGSSFDVVALNLGVVAFGSNDISVNSNIDAVTLTNNGTGRLSVTDVDTLALLGAAANSGTTEVNSALGFDLTIDEDVNLEGAQGDLVLNSGNNLVVNAVIADLTGAQTNTGNIALNAGGAVTFAGTASADAGSGNIAINANGDVTLAGVAGSSITVDSAAQILDGNGAAVNLVGGTATLTAAGDIGTAAQPLDVALNELLLAGQNVYLQSPSTLAAAVAGNASVENLVINAGADLTLQGGSGSINGDANFSVASGALLLPEGGLSVPGSLQVQADYIAASSGPVVLQANDAVIRLNASANATELNTTFNSLVLQVAGDQSVSINNGGDLNVAGVNTLGDLNLQSAGNLSINDADASFAGNLTLSAAGDLNLAEGILSVPDTLTITAQNLSDGDNNVELGANTAVLNLQQDAALTLASAVGSLDFNNAGSASVTINESDSLTVLGLNTGADLAINSAAGDIEFSTESVAVGGLLSLATVGSGAIVLPQLGLTTPGGLQVNAASLRDSDNQVTLAARDADITLRDGGIASVWDTTFDSLIADVAGDLSVSDSDDLAIAGLSVAGNAQVATASGDLQLNANPQVAGSLSLIASGSGDVVLSDGSLNHVGALLINANNLRGSGNQVTLAASDADITLREGSAAHLWNTAFDTLTANVAGDLTVVDVDGLSLLGLASAGAADISATGGNLVVSAAPSVGGELRLTTVDSGDLVLPVNGLQHQGALRLEANHIVDDDAEVTLAANQLIINQRQGDTDTTFNTTSEALQLTFNGSNAVYVNETGDLQLVNLLAGGNASISAGGDISLPDALDVRGLLSLSTSGAGQVIVGESGIDTSGDLFLDSAAISGAAEVLVQANAADIILRNQQQPLTLATGVQQLGITSASAARINIAQATDLTLTTLTAGGDVNVTAGANLTVLPSQAAVSGSLSLDVAELLTIADGGLSTGAALSVDAAAVANASGLGSTQWQAQRADFRIRQSVQNNRLDTSVSELGLRFDASAPLTVTTQAATGITGVSANNNLHIISAGDLAMQTALTSVNGLLTLEANGDLQLTDNGLTVMDALQVDARNLSSSAGSVMLNGNRADINLTGTSALDLNTRLEALGLSFASTEALRLNNSGNLTINRWQAGSADSVGMTVDGALTVPQSGLAAARLLRIDAHDLSDGDRNLTLQAPQLQVRLSASATDHIWQVDSDQFDVTLRGKANLQVLANDGLALADLNGDGYAVSLEDGNFTLELDSGDLHINSNITAQDQSADGVRSGIIDIVAAGGDIVVGAEQDVAILSSNTVDGNVSGDSENAIRLQLSDNSNTSRRIALGNGSNSVVLRAVGGDIALHARPLGSTTRARREIVQNAGVNITAYNNPGDAPGGTVFINGDQQTPQPWQDIREGRTLALLADFTNGPDFDAIQDELDDMGDTIVEVEPTPEQGADAAQQFEAVFGRCDELDRSGSRRCRVDAALKSFLSHWLVGGEMPPKSEI